jgi:hypothetical protein
MSIRKILFEFNKSFLVTTGRILYSLLEVGSLLSRYPITNRLMCSVTRIKRLYLHSQSFDRYSGQGRCIVVENCQRATFPPIRLRTGLTPYLHDENSLNVNIPRYYHTLRDDQMQNVHIFALLRVTSSAFEVWPWNPLWLKMQEFKATRLTRLTRNVISAKSMANWADDLLQLAQVPCSIKSFWRGRYPITPMWYTPPAYALNNRISSMSL